MRIDAHHHFWSIETGEYDWPTAADGPIHRTFGPADLEPELIAAGIDRTVLVQTVNTLADTDAMLAAAAAHAWIGGVVGWVPLDDVDAATAELDARQSDTLVGIRHLIHREPDPTWLTRSSVRTSLGVLAERGLAFDVVAVFPDHLHLVPELADALPNLTFVIDHLAKPPIRAAGWATWRAELARAAQRPNVAAKLSGLDTAAGPGWTVAELAPSIDVALEAFGADRLLFGSDWPVSRLVSGYRDVVAATETLIATLSPAEQDAIMGHTAREIYGLAL